MKGGELRRDSGWRLGGCWRYRLCDIDSNEAAE